MIISTYFTLIKFLTNFRGPWLVSLKLNFELSDISFICAISFGIQQIMKSLSSVNDKGFILSYALTRVSRSNLVILQNISLLPCLLWNLDSRVGSVLLSSRTYLTFTLLHSGHKKKVKIGDFVKVKEKEPHSFSFLFVRLLSLDLWSCNFSYKSSEYGCFVFDLKSLMNFSWGFKINLEIYW